MDHRLSLRSTLAHHLHPCMRLSGILLYVRPYESTSDGLIASTSQAITFPSPLLPLRFNRYASVEGLPAQLSLALFRRPTRHSPWRHRSYLSSAPSAPPCFLKPTRIRRCALTASCSLFPYRIKASSSSFLPPRHHLPSAATFLTLDRYLASLPRSSMASSPHCCSHR